MEYFLIFQGCAIPSQDPTRVGGNCSQLGPLHSFPRKGILKKPKCLGYLSCLRFLTAPFPQINHALVLKSWIQFHIQGTLVQNPLYFCSTFTGQLPKNQGYRFVPDEGSQLLGSGRDNAPRQQQTAIPLCYSWPPPTPVWSCILEFWPSGQFWLTAPLSASPQIPPSKYLIKNTFGISFKASR